VYMYDLGGSRRGAGSSRLCGHCRRGRRRSHLAVCCPRGGLRFGSLRNFAAQVAGTARTVCRAWRVGGDVGPRAWTIVSHPGLVVQPPNERERDPEINTWVVIHVRDACRGSCREQKAGPSVFRARDRTRLRATDDSGRDVSSSARSRGVSRTAGPPAKRSWSTRDRSGSAVPGAGSRSADKDESGMRWRGPLLNHFLP
jgi:hypothetical protein